MSSKSDDLISGPYMSVIVGVLGKLEASDPARSEFMPSPFILILFSLLPVIVILSVPFGILSDRFFSVFKFTRIDPSFFTDAGEVNVEEFPDWPSPNIELVPVKKTLPPPAFMRTSENGPCPRGDTDLETSFNPFSNASLDIDIENVSLIDLLAASGVSSTFSCGSQILFDSILTGISKYEVGEGPSPTNLAIFKRPLL